MSLPTYCSARPPAPSFAPRATAVVAAALVLAACGGKEAPKPPPVPEVSVAEVIQRDVPILSELTGTLRGFEDIEIRARVEGFLRSVDYREGTEVKKGQLLFTIDDQPYRAKLAEAKGELARAQSSLVQGDPRREAVQAARRAARRQPGRARQRRRRAALGAGPGGRREGERGEGRRSTSGTRGSPRPSTASRARRSARSGDLVGKGEPTLLTTVSSIDPVRVSVEPPGGAVPPVREPLPAPGDTAPRKPSADQPGAELILGDGTVYPERGQLVLVDRAVDPQTGTLRVDLVLPQPEEDPPARPLREGAVPRGDPPGGAARAAARGRRAPGPVLRGGGERGGKGRDAHGEGGPAGGQPVDPGRGREARREGHRRGRAQGPRRHGGEGDGRSRRDARGGNRRRSAGTRRPSAGTWRRSTGIRRRSDRRCGTDARLDRLGEAPAAPKR